MHVIPFKCNQKGPGLPASIFIGGESAVGSWSCDGGRCGIGGGGGGGFFEPASQCKLQAAGMVEHLQSEICLCRVSLTNPFISNLVLCQR